VNRQEKKVTVVEFTSSFHPEIMSTRPEDGDIIAWADDNPVAWRIIHGNRSKVFGRYAKTYSALGRSDAAAGAIYRASVLRQWAVINSESSIFGWRARFTLKHYDAKGFNGGFFQQFDGKYPRRCIHMDYTPGTLDEVIDHFVAWCGTEYPMVAVHLEGKTVRTVKRDVEVAP